MERTTPAVGDVGAVGARVVTGGGWWAVAMGVGVVIGASGAIAQQAQPGQTAAQPPAQPTPVQPTPAQLAAAEQEAKAALLVQQGKESWDQKNYERVIRKYRQFAQEFPNRPEVTAARYYHAMARVEMPNVDWNVVADELSKVAGAKDVPSRGNSNYWLGVALRMKGGNDAATKSAEAFAAAEVALLAEKNPASTELAARAKVEAARALVLAGKVAEAIERVKPFVADANFAKVAARPEALLLLGQVQFEAKDYPSAFTTLASLAPFDQGAAGMQGRFLLGRILEETDQKPEAVVQYDAVVKTYAQERLKAQRSLADPNAWKGKPLERLATEALVKAVPEFVVSASYRAAMIQFAYGQHAEAMAKFQQVVSGPVAELKPVAMLHVGICAVQLKQPEMARVLDGLREHATLGDQAWWWKGRLQRAQAEPANAGQAQNQYRAALADFATAAKKAAALAAGDPAAAARRGDILLDQADTHALLKQFKEAAAIYAELAKESGERGEVAGEKLAMALHKAGDYASSEQACAAFLQKNPQSMLRPSIMFWQAENALKQGQQEQATARYQAVIEKYPEFAHAGAARFGLGMSLYKKGEYAKAGKVLSGILSPDRVGELTAASYYEADCLLRTLPESGDDALSAARLAKQLEDATGLLSNFVGTGEERPETPDALLKLAECYQRNMGIIADMQEKTRLYTGARDTYDKLIQKYPTHPAMPRAVMERAGMIAATGDVGQAINELNRFRADANLARSEVAPVALMRLSDLMVRSGRAVDAAAMMEKARADFEKTLAADPKKATVVAQLRYHHGVALREAGKAKEALALFEGIIKEWPSSAEAAEASLASIQVKKKDALDKLKGTRHAVAAAPVDKPIDPKLLDAITEAGKSAGQIAEAFEKHAEKIAEKSEGSDLHVRTLRDAALTWRAVGEAEVEAARRARAEESLKKMQARLAAKPPTTGKSNSLPRAPQIRLTSVGIQPGEKKAREAYTKALEAGGQSALANDIRLELADLHVQRGEADQAIALISAAIDQNPPQPVIETLRIRLGRSLLLKGDAAAALVQAEECLKDTNSPIRPSAYLLKGHALIAQKKWAEATTILSRYLNGAEKYRNAGPVTEEGLMAFAEASRAAGAPEQARVAYENLIQRFAASKWVPEAWFGTGMALQQAKQFDGAVRAFTEATRKTTSETAAKAQHQIGLCRAEQKRWQDAVNELLVVPATYDYAEVSAKSSLEAAKALVELKEKDRAKEVLKGVVEDHPSTAWATEAAKRLAEIQ